MDNKLYKEFASYYAAMSNHRNFKGQLDYILQSYSPEQPCSTMMELFAGQSLHSIAALEKGDIDVWALDGSPEMKELALSEGFKNPDQYIVGDLPESILECVGKVKFDCILCLYHGICNLTIVDAYELLKNLKKVLNNNGKVFLEIHNIYKIMEYIGSPGTRYVETTTSKGETIKFAWPSGPIRWNTYDYNAEVPVEIIIESEKGTETIDFVSEDRIYSAEGIDFIGSLLGYECRVMIHDVPGREHFGQSVILELLHARPDENQ